MIKKVLLTTLFVAGIALLNAQQKQGKCTKCTDQNKCEKCEKNTAKHVCTDECHKTGKCVLKHGEKGHICTDACKK